jgi:hypothetical protein
VVIKIGGDIIFVVSVQVFYCTYVEDKKALYFSVHSQREARAKSGPYVRRTSHHHDVEGVFIYCESVCFRLRRLPNLNVVVK